ncbi:LysR family transcriptional regulator [Microbacterium sp. JB110]|uniref:LysR family transcriptional regulator n=1 Tax=unclassified Microbacterium TaxID=2609290 RepID=UPI00097F1C6D|nr:LysR family transcriptional regulator [Microbacterium sp. JB110]SJM50889.1 transcriptional regulator, LysR family [Frigoribacterium sp. JB110]
MNITLRQLAHFRAAARAGSISGAAEREHVSRSSIAAAIDDLERVLGLTLCIRTKAAGIELTQQGEEVLAQAADVLQRAGAIESLGRGDGPSGTVTVGCFPSLAPTVMAAAWATMAKRHPDVTLHVVSLGKDQIVDGVRTGQLDCGLAYNLQVHPELRTTAIYDTEMHAILSPDHPLAAHRVVEAGDLIDQPLILMDVSPSVEDTMAYFDACGLVPRVLTRTPNFEFIRSLVARGVGYSLFIQRPRNRMSYEGRPIVTRRLTPRPHRETATFAWRADREQSSAVRALQQVLLDAAPELAPFDSEDG